jgi:hypothetical protein
MKGCLQDSNPNNRLPLYTTPNPLGILKKIPKKLIPLMMRLTHLDRIAMEVLLATITVPDEKVKQYIETKLVGLIKKIEEPAKEAVEKFAGNVIEPIFRAVPFVNLTYALGDIQKAGETIDDVQGKGATALESVVNEARDLYEDIQGPSRVLSSLILGLGNYIERIQDKIDAGEKLTKEDVSAMNLYKEIGKDNDVSPTKDTPKRAAARLIASNLIQNLRKEEDDGIINPDRELIRNTADFLKGDGKTTGAETKELETVPGDGLLQVLLGSSEESESTSRKTKKTRKKSQKKSSSNSRHRAQGSKKTRRILHK